MPFFSLFSFTFCTFKNYPKNETKKSPFKRGAQSKFLGTMKNVYNFFTLYANTDDIDPKDFFVEYKDRPELDRWILSKYNSLVKSTVENLEIFEVNRVIRNIKHS